MPRHAVPLSEGAEMGCVANVQKYSLSDGGGIRTIVFFKGCPLRCAWCHNPETWEAAPQLMVSGAKCIGCGRCAVCGTGAIGPGQPYDRSRCTGCGECAQACPSGALEWVGRQVTADALLREIEADDLFYAASGGGVTLSGGEPLMQHGFALSLARQLKTQMYDLVIETSGFAEWEYAEPLLKLADEVLYDIKLMDGEAHRRYTGMSNNRILENAAKAAAMGVNLTIRVPVIGGVNAAPEEITRIGGFARDIGVRRVELLGYHRYGESKYARLGMPAPSGFYAMPEAEMHILAQMLRNRYNLEVIVEVH